jgi:hypothetical protein
MGLIGRRLPSDRVPRRELSGTLPILPIAGGAHIGRSVDAE